jgi:hypothetical protein
MDYRGVTAQKFGKIATLGSSEILACKLEPFVVHCCGKVRDWLLFIEKPCVIQYEVSLHRQDSASNGVLFKT